MAECSATSFLLIGICAGRGRRGNRAAHVAAIAVIGHPVIQNAGAVSVAIQNVVVVIESAAGVPILNDAVPVIYHAVIDIGGNIGTGRRHGRGHRADPDGVIHVAVAAAGKTEQEQQDRCKICKRLFHIHPPDFLIVSLQE